MALRCAPLLLGLALANAQDGAVIELAGDSPKILFGLLDSTICEVALNRTKGHLTSTCDIHTPSNVMALIHNLTEIVGSQQARLDSLEAQVESMRHFVGMLPPSPPLPPSASPPPPPAYFASTTTFNNWNGAQSYCVAQGGRLAEVHDAHQNAALGLVSAGNRGWMGAQGSRGAGWIWNSGAQFTFTNWNTGEPNYGHQTTTHCLEVEPNGGWNDAPCSFTSRYAFCEMWA